MLFEDLCQISPFDKGVVVSFKIPQLHMYHIPEFKDILQKTLATQPKLVIFDLENLQYLDSSGMGALFQLHKQIIGYGGRMVLTNINQTIRMVFHLTRSDQFFTITDSLDQAKLI